MLDAGYAPEDIRAAQLREMSRRSLHNFVKQAWHVVEPARPFVDNWHIGAVTEHLEAVSRFEINRLLIMVPPGTMKSLNVSVFWPAWEWGPNSHPHRRFLFSSYSNRLSIRDSLRTRRVIKSPWYQSLWGRKFELLEDRDTMSVFHNNHTGFRLATSTRGVSTGERGDVVVVDDPHNVVEAESEKRREAVLEWWDEAMSSRVNDPEDSAFVVVMQRLHQHDLAGHLMKQGGYTVLRLPMEFEEQHRCFTSVRPRAFKGKPADRYCWDPRTKEGELLFPQRVSAAAVQDLKNRLGSYASAAQLQQRPSPRGGGLVKLPWFGRFRERPGKNKVLRIIQSWDTASKGGVENAYSVCGTWYQCDTGYYLVHVLRERMNNARLRRTAVQMAVRFNPGAIVIEDKSSGTALIEHLRDPKEHKAPDGLTFNVFGMNPDKDKITRMDIEAPTVEAGNVWLPEEADWLPEFEAEVEAFPNADYMDQVDMLSQTLKWIRTHPIGQDWGLY